MSEKLIFKQGITSINIIDKKETDFYKYKTYYTLFYIIKIKITPGFYDIFENFTSNETILNGNYLIIDNKVYIKPKIIINLNNGKSEIIYFNQLSDCYDYIKIKSLDLIPKIVINGNN